MTYRDPTAENGNRIHWDEIAPVHSKSYDLTKLRSGGHLLDEIQVKELGDISGKSLLHLQCHIGSDTLSLARLGAKVTGIDFSEKSIEQAKLLSKELNIPADFILSNVYDLPKHLDQEFDVVYTSEGVLCWLSDLTTWAEIIFRYLKPGGMFYIMESHPFRYVFDDENSEDLIAKNSYFHKKEATLWDDEWPDYSDENYITKTPSYEWHWALSDIMNALIRVGLKIELFNEYDKVFYKAQPDMIRKGDGWWYLPEDKAKIPLVFSLRARK